MNNSTKPQRPPWYERPVWIVALLVVFFPVGLFVMWRFAEWEPRTKRIVTSLFIWPMAAWWLWRSGRPRWQIGLASFAGLIWLAIAVGVFTASDGAGDSSPEQVVQPPADATASATAGPVATTRPTQSPTAARPTPTPTPAATAGEQSWGFKLAIIDGLDVSGESDVEVILLNGMLGLLADRCADADEERIADSSVVGQRALAEGGVELEIFQFLSAMDEATAGQEGTECIPIAAALVTLILARQ